MKGFFRKTICTLMMGILLIISTVASGVYATAVGNIGMTINGKVINLDQPPVSENGRTLVPLRAIFEGLGAEVQWDSKSQIITGTKGNIVIKLKIGSKVADVSGKSVMLDVPAKIINGRTLVPARFIAENLGANVEWDSNNRIVKITAKAVTQVISKAKVEEYISTFTTTMEIIDESMESYNLALLTLAIGENIYVEIHDLNNINQELYSLFSSFGKIDGFQESQIYMKDALYYYGLALASSEILATNIILEKEEMDLNPTYLIIKENLLKAVSNKGKALESVNREKEAYIKGN